MLRAALALLLFLAGLAPAASAECYAMGQACWNERATGDCSTYGQGWTDLQVRNAMLGAPLHLHRHAWHTCTEGGHRTDTWHLNATAGDARANTTWTSHPKSDWSLMRAELRGPMTNQTTTWYSTRGDCDVWAYGTLLGATLNDHAHCPRGPPSVPVFPWDGLLP